LSGCIVLIGNKRKAMNIFVGNINYKLTHESLEALFTPYGKVASVRIIIDKATGRSKGFGFVDMPDDAEALQAIKALHETEVMDRKMIVSEAKPTPRA
jgi:RNA recognition motif-containing protein